MKILLFVITLILLLFSVQLSSADVWIPDSDIASGLSIAQHYSKPEAFCDNGTWKLITGQGTGLFKGFYWDGSTWVTDSSVSGGLGDMGFNSAPEVFNDSGTLKLISGRSNAFFSGFYWNGTIWISDPSIVTGLGSIHFNSAPTVFDDEGTWKLIAGNDNGHFYGWYWNGTSWISDPSIKNGLSSGSSESTPTVFDDDGTWNLILGGNDGKFRGFYWNGSTWILDTSIILGLVDVGEWSAPEVFNDGGTLKLITGAFDGGFDGYYLSPTFTLSGTITNEDGPVNNASITLSDAGGSTTSNEIGYYEITGVLSDTYTIDVTETLHYDYSDTVSITSDTEENIFLTLLSIISVIAPPPFVPIEEMTPEPTPIEEMTIFEEMIEEIKKLTLENIMIYAGKGLSWSFIIASYIGVLASHILSKERDEEYNIFDILLFGTITWILLLLINSLGLIGILSTSFMTNLLIFGFAGFAVYTTFKMFNNQNQSEQRPGIK